jgi:hypothetical protein
MKEEATGEAKSSTVFTVLAIQQGKRLTAVTKYLLLISRGAINKMSEQLMTMT